MGSWRALIGRGRPRFLSSSPSSSAAPFSFLKVVQAEQQHQQQARSVAAWLLAPLAREDGQWKKVHDALPIGKEGVGSGPGLGAGASQAFVKEGSGLGTGASSEDLEASLLDFLEHRSHKHAEGAPLGFQLWEPCIRASGFCGSEDLTMEADSVKRKRKKKMNKHKHRKLRRLARKSKK